MWTFRAICIEDLRFVIEDCIVDWAIEDCGFSILNPPMARSRRTHSNGMSAGTSTLVVRPFTVRE